MWGWKALLVVSLILISLVNGAGVLMPVVKGKRVSKSSNSSSSLSIFMSLQYSELDDNNVLDSYQASKHILVNDTEIVQLLDFKKKDKRKLTYDDLRFTVLNDTKMSTLLENFLFESLENTIALDKSYVSFTRDFDSVSKNQENDTIEYRPSGYHMHKKFILGGAVLPTYLLIGIVCLIAYLGRNKFIPDGRRHLFKLSNISRFLSKFIWLRLSYDLIHFGYLILFMNFDFFNRNGFLYFCFLFADELINLVAFYFVIAIFVQGFMTLKQDRSTLFLFPTIALTVLHLISVTAVKIYYNAKPEMDFGSYRSRNHNEIESLSIDATSFIAPVVVLSKMTVFFYGAYVAYTTYQTAQRKDPRFINSIIVIASAYYLSSCLSIPVFYSFQDAGEFFKSLFLDISPDFYFRHLQVPQLLQLAICCWLIYYWRDLNYDKVPDSDATERSYELH